jgi:hypothetical protein
MMSGKIRSLVWCPAKQKGAAIGPLLYPQPSAFNLSPIRSGCSA